MLLRLRRAAKLILGVGGMSGSLWKATKIGKLRGCKC